MVRTFCAASVAALLALTLFSAGSRAQSAAQPDLTKQPTLYAIGYAHLDTEWRWEYPQVIDEFLPKTMQENFALIQKYPHYIFNFTGVNRYRMMKEYYPAQFAEIQKYVAEGRWYPAGSSVEEGDVNAPSAEAIIRQVLYGNDWFRKEFGKASEEFMLPDCFGFPASLPTILAAAGVKGFSTQKLTWGSSANVGGPDSIERTPAGTPFNVGVWVGPDGESVIAALNPGAYDGGIYSDLSQPLPPLPPSAALADVTAKIAQLQQTLQSEGKAANPNDVRRYIALRQEQSALDAARQREEFERYQGDWAARVLANGKATGLYADYHYYGTGDTGGAPDEESVKRLEAIMTKGSVGLPAQTGFGFLGGRQSVGPAVQVGDGPVHVISATSDQMFRDITPAEAARLPRYTGELELTNHSAGSLTSETYQKRWIRKEELLADAAEKSSVAALWLGARPYPIQRLNGAWMLALAAHFHDLAAGTATPRAYEFAWNDDTIAMNQFADVLKSATEAVADGLDTEGRGIPVVVYNPLNIARQDVVAARVNFPGGMPEAVHVVGPDGKSEPAQIDGNKVLFLARVPSVGYAVYDMRAGAAPGAAALSALHVSKYELENQYYRVKLDANGDVASIYDKALGRELLAGPARLAISYDNPTQWPAWNMDWDQEQAAPRAYVSGPAQIRVVEDGPVRVAIQVSRQTDGSRFLQTISLAAGGAGKRVVFGNVIDWNTRESNLRSVFPLTASNRWATYNLDVGTIRRPTAQPKKFEALAHQWIDLTDMSGKFGATILTNCKNGSDKPNDHTIRLTLIRTPGTAGGYPDQGTQDIGHHEFTYGFAGHADGWRSAQTDWQAERLNDPLIAFQTTPHAGELGRTFSMLRISNPRIRVMALKRAEEDNEVIVRMVELDGKPESNVRVSFAAPVLSAREVNGQEQPIGSATVNDGVLVTSFGAYQPRTFAVRLAAPKTQIPGVESEPVALHYDAATATNHGGRSTVGFDGKGDALPAEMLPAQIMFNDVRFQLAPAKTGAPNAVIAKGQTIQLPAGNYNRVYILAASAHGDQRAAFAAGSNKVTLDVEDWGGFIGQWDDRIWSSKDTSHENYGEMIGLRPGFIKRASLAWYSDHYHNPAGENVAYRYSYLFGYGIDLPAGAHTLRLPDNPDIRVLAVSVAEENPQARPVQPLYDVLPSQHPGPVDFALTAPQAISVAQGRTASKWVVVLPWGNFKGRVALAASQLPSGVAANFGPANASGSRLLTLTVGKDAAPGTTQFTITGTSDGIKHTVPATVTVTQVLTGTVPVNLSSAANVTAIYTDGSKFSSSAGADGGGYALSAQALGKNPVGGGVVFRIGSAGAPDAVTSRSVALPAGRYASLKLLAFGVDGVQPMQVFTVHYTDGTSSTFTQSLSDWAEPGQLRGESADVSMAYRTVSDGTTDAGPFHAYTYSFPLDTGKTVDRVSLPGNRNVVLLAMTLVPAQ